MKTILVPTDFSKISRNAINYAVEIAKLTKSKIILFHAYYVPIVTTDVMVVPPLVEIEEGNMSVLKKIEKNIRAKHGDKVVIESKCKYGLPTDEINQFAKKNKVDLIIMGMHGSGVLSQKFIGSTTTSLIRKSKTPILVIDRRVKFKKIKKIALACDFEEIPKKSILNPLKEIVHLFKAHVNVINIVDDIKKLPTVKKAVVGIKLEHALEDINHTFYFAENKNVVEGINQFIKEKKMDMVVMIPRKHSLLKRIFNEPQTKRIAFHTNVPLLALHE
ncbi:MAG: universal stress protein [Bacteroidota bacterium]|nr:universal stress protein [Bacteroidota bacterium]MDP3145856.1 universal stress protein [Bacteroidota bacterium]MDP3558490.1 universal stress protein [Bacteroidota bacterium]